MDDLLHRGAKYPSAAPRGAVLVELALALPLLFLCMGAVIDYAAVLKEQTVLNEAVRAALRVVVAAPPYKPGNPDTEEDRAAYVETRYQRGIEIAQRVVSRNGFNADNYNFNIFNISANRDNRGNGPERNMVQVNIGARQHRQFVFPNMLWRSCAGMGAMLPGVVLGTDYSVVDPELDSNCNPQ
jgi:hypothetical protein